MKSISIRRPRPAAATEKPPTKMTAVEAVLGTGELLELILLSLGNTRRILLVQRVSRYWYNVISSSGALQQALFFAPRRAPTPVAGESDTEALRRQRMGWELNCLLEEFFSEWFELRKASSLSISPALENRRQLFLRAGASWRRMLVCQPPSYALPVFSRHFDVGTIEPMEQKFGTMRLPDGLRMGTLYDFVLQKRIEGLVDCSALWVPAGHQKFRPCDFRMQVWKNIVSGYGTDTYVLLLIQHFESDVYPDSPQKYDKATMASLRCEDHQDVEVVMKPYGARSR